ncbi:diphosphate--fructose-6-phosphate 1-phosphotransferase [Candidatus Aerophobetes bacterium]|uniref:Pyrophosphate--fructose 6-phosphate 1-phosphotransferase n=1 Tax=Aerophobetes bacterium TaxID=2030807 RepID=A0A2A4X8M1_UNCAE|nr:MAG: diphosphate--fructose-6-phosphate 1-phosphotransferase [Candidatus Aerophobetes bacterium]
MASNPSFAQIRRKYQPKIPACFEQIETCTMVASKESGGFSLAKGIDASFVHSKNLPLFVAGTTSARDKKKKVVIGVVFSGGQASGGHNVVAGIFDALKKCHPDSKLLGFLKGPKGILTNSYQDLDEKIVQMYRNQGGFDMIGSGRDKIETEQDLEKAKIACEANALDGLVIIGGDDSNTNAALLAEYFLAKGVKTAVVGVPKTIDGDLQNAYVQISFGFDTATKVYSNLISNIQKDAKSSCKYTHFIKLMGRSASHVALECALQTHPTFTLISEDVADKKQTLSSIIHKMCDILQARQKKDKPYAVFLLPEGIIEFIPQMRALIDEINQWCSTRENQEQEQDDLVHLIQQQLSEKTLEAWHLLPPDLKAQLLLDRDPHGNVQVSHIQTEKLFSFAIAKELKKREKQGLGKTSFSPVYHFFGYEGRSTFPSNFDANYCYSLGFVAWLLIQAGATGRMCALQNLHLKPSKWEPVGIPITRLMAFEKRKGKMKPVITKALVDLQSSAFNHFRKNAAAWEEIDDDQSIGPIQFEGPEFITDSIPLIVQLGVKK